LTGGSLAYIATGGSLGSRQLELLRLLFKRVMRSDRVWITVGTDNDPAGDAMYDEIAAIAPVKVYRSAPIGKDWSADLTWTFREVSTPEKPLQVTVETVVPVSPPPDPPAPPPPGPPAPAPAMAWVKCGKCAHAESPDKFGWVKCSAGLKGNFVTKAILCASFQIRGKAVSL